LRIQSTGVPPHTPTKNVKHTSDGCALKNTPPNTKHESDGRDLKHTPPNTQHKSGRALKNTPPNTQHKSGRALKNTPPNTNHESVGSELKNTPHNKKDITAYTQKNNIINTKHKNININKTHVDSHQHIQHKNKQKINDESLIHNAVTSTTNVLQHDFDTHNDTQTKHNINNFTYDQKTEIFDHDQKTEIFDHHNKTLPFSNSKESIDKQLTNRWTPSRPTPTTIDPRDTFRRVLDVHNRATSHTEQHPLTNEPITLPRVPHNEEKSLPAKLLNDLRTARQHTSTMGIPHERVWVHEAWESFDNAILKGSPIWYNSADVSIYAPQMIPQPATAGFPRSDNFCEPLLPCLVPEIPRHPNITFNVDQWIKDIHKCSLDANLMAYMLTGTPQSYMGPLISFIHDNYPMDEATYKQFWERIDTEHKAGRCRIIKGRNALTKKFPYHIASPLGSVPKNTKAARLLRAGLPAPRRPIQDASKTTPAGSSVNNCSCYEYMHKVCLPKVEELIDDILWLADRCLEFGFPSHRGRIRSWKRDFTGAYRYLLLHPTDEWLAIFGIIDRDNKYKLFINDIVSAFGHRKAVTIWCRFAYSLTTFSSTPGWCAKHFPQLALDPRTGDEKLTEAPPANTLNIDKFRRGPSAMHGNADPKIGTRRRDYIDDMMGFTINVHDNPNYIFSACSATGVRHAMGKMEATKCRDYNVQVSVKKRKENGPLLRGLLAPDLIGFTFLLDELMIQLTDSFASDTLSLTKEFTIENHVFSPKEWNSLAGKLGRVVIVYPSTKNLMREIWIIADIAERRQTTFRTSAEIRNCLRLISIVLTKNPGRDMRFSKEYRSSFIHGLDLSIGKPNAAHGLSDASTSVGLAIVNLLNGMYYFRKWREWELAVARGKIFILEAIGTFFLVRIMLSSLNNKRVVIWGDNEALVKALNNAASGDLITNGIVRLISLDLALHNVVLCGDKEIISFNHCNTVEMGPYADALTRNKEDLFLEHMKQHHSDVTPQRLSDTHHTIQKAEHDLHSLFSFFIQKRSSTQKRHRTHRPSAAGRHRRRKSQPRNNKHNNNKHDTNK